MYEANIAVPFAYSLYAQQTNDQEKWEKQLGVNISLIKPFIESKTLLCP